MLPFPSVIDSTILVSFRACEMQAKYAFGDKLAVAETSLDLHFGGAFASGLEVARKAFFLNGKNEDEAICLGINAALDFWGQYIGPAEKAKSWDTLILALDGYFKRWPLSHDFRPAFGGKAIEFTFAIPIEECRRPDNGEPILYGGRFDMIAEMPEFLAGLDDKTTGSGFGPTWVKKWNLRNQFMGYCWGAQQHGIPVNRFLVRGINILKTKIDYTEAMPEFPQYLINRWHEQLITDLNRMAAAWKSGAFSYNFGDTCSAYGLCDFFDLCYSRQAEDWTSMFKTREWNPLEKEPSKTLLEEKAA